MITFLYQDNETGESFLVEASDRKEADEIAQTEFLSPIFWEIISTEEAEGLGLDTY